MKQPSHIKVKRPLKWSRWPRRANSKFSQLYCTVFHLHHVFFHRGPDVDWWGQDWVFCSRITYLCAQHLHITTESRRRSLWVLTSRHSKWNPTTARLLTISKWMYIIISAYLPTSAIIIIIRFAIARHQQTPQSTHKQWHSQAINQSFKIILWVRLLPDWVGRLESGFIHQKNPYLARYIISISMPYSAETKNMGKRKKKRNSSWD